MTEKKLDTKELSTRIESEFKRIIMSGSGLEGDFHQVTNYIAYLTEKVTQAILSGCPDLAESFQQSARVRAAALRVRISKEKTAQIAAFAGTTIRILAGVLL